MGRAADDLRAVGLSAARVWADYPPTPWWWWPAFAALWAGFVVAATRAVELSNVWLFDAAAVVLAVGELALLYHHRRVRGAWPRLATMPPEIRTLVGRQFVLTAGVAVVVVLLCLAGWSLVAAGLTFAYLALGGGIVYERAYRRAADAAVARVSV